MAGSSLGGLISAYAGYQYAGRSAASHVFSPSLWGQNGHMISDGLAHGRPDVARWYQDHGHDRGGSYQ